MKRVSPIYSYEINTDNVSELNLQKIADLDKIIPLETKDECLINSIGKVFISDSALVVWDKGNNNIFVFDNAGRYQRSIGRSGPSPEEYINIGDVQMQNDTVQILDVATRRILNYNISGKFISSIQSAYYLYTFYVVPEGCWGINVYQNKDHYNLILLDENLQKIKRGCFASDQVLPLCPTNNFSKNEKNGELIFHYQDNDTIYKIQEDSILPFIALEFGKNEELKGGDVESSKGHIHDVHLYGDHLFFSFSHALKDKMPYVGYNCYISLKNSEMTVYDFNVVHDEKILVSPLPEIVNISKGKLIYQIVPGEFPEKVFDRLKETSLGFMNNESNPVLILYNLKE
ncbi:6-bladed beta-propeller [Bacteroides sp.]|uniref:6-bladed beta-propeller n=1 Tax=Bacteroides sp. TaxID=29523 RepID=UPI002602EB06|nr:6-bladed beta-propeller [Bacteroides sp.]MDD3039913.1 6-bladed beta-propeller [Bacteroides sp.]